MPVKNKIERGFEPNKERILRAGGQHGIVEVEKTKVHRMMDSSILDLLLSRGQIDGEQYAAGTRFNRDWFQSGLSGAGAIDYSKVRVDTSTDVKVSHRAIDAMTRFNHAVRAIGKIHCHPLTSMVLLEMTPEEYGRTRCRQNNPKLGRLAAITLLIASLDALCEHYTT
jgi:hypothetical protein